MTEINLKSLRSPAGLIGIALVVIGILFIVGQFTGLGIGHSAWTLFIIVPGVLLFLFSLRWDEPIGVGLVILGSIVSMTGFLLLYQSIFQHWASWAYAWSLIAPGGVGFGLWFYGRRRNLPEMVHSGDVLIKIGLILYIVGFIFFELLLGISGRGAGSFASAVVMILAGAYLIVRNSIPGLGKK